MATTTQAWKSCAFGLMLACLPEDDAGGSGGGLGGDGPGGASEETDADRETDSSDSDGPANEAPGDQSGTVPGGGDPSCQPMTCASMGYSCGAPDDGCGTALSCGGCEGSDVCVTGTCVSENDLVHARVDNPFMDTAFYINPDYADAVLGSAAQEPELAQAMETVAAQPTAVWLDRIAAIDPSDTRLGLRQHLDEALVQLDAAGSDATMTVVVVVYDLPNRDCAAAASNGELMGADGMARYRTEFIDRIAAEITAQPRYRQLRIALVLEPDSLPNVVTNQDIESCVTAAPIYEDGISYAISTFAEIEHAYVYLDIAHSGWLGWQHAETAATVYRRVLDRAGGEQAISGFATNVSNYSTLEESFDPVAAEHMALLEGFYEYNRVVDELGFVDSLRPHFPSAGFVIDTGRNGWAQDAVPREQREHRGNWCNIAGAGIGERPRGNPLPGQLGGQIHAYFWIKPPGESDGTSDETATEPNEEGKSFDEMCAGGQNDSMADAPHAGGWFHENFTMLVRNAQPPLE